MTTKSYFVSATSVYRLLGTVGIRLAVVALFRRGVPISTGETVSVPRWPAKVGWVVVQVGKVKLAGEGALERLFPDQDVGERARDLPQARVADAGKATKQAQIEPPFTEVPTVVAS